MMAMSALRDWSPFAISVRFASAEMPENSSRMGQDRCARLCRSVGPGKIHGIGINRHKL